ncbi:transglycosylase domain-containing protein [Paenibacillus sp. MMS18-CY102]|uniref:transglycosylase domain-containing protein n=1 Tax=Paenibacillus sp. MMS18-CY102 TaxID=2682849 RepID=UPI001366241C|nr:PBP1A family penicillin-binding protein [Paenibacillus sp. MMS18-CY102]MWC31072.1 PBP1A family penicillin-binding protein [Paenibacillus sp. MMS18-CY102]
MIKGWFHRISGRSASSKTARPLSAKAKARAAKRRRPPIFPLIAERLWPRLSGRAKWMRRAKLAGVAAGLFIVMIAGSLLYLRVQSLPVSSITQTSQMLDLQGNVIDTFHTNQNRSSVPLNQISPFVVQATLAIEDRRFYDHGGFDLKGMARAVVVNVENLSTKQGASTLTQQLARNLYLTHERTWKRKLKEAIYTTQLEMHYSKDEILNMYLNQIYYGHGAYGIEAAAMQYFGKHASELDLAESALLAGIPKGPKYYSPYNNMKNAKDRQLTILDAMATGGSITQAQADAAYAELLPFKPLEESRGDGFAPYFRDYIRSFVVGELGFDERLLTEGGIRIFTTLDPEAQRAAEKAVADGIPSDSEQQAALIAIDPRNGYVKAMVGGRDYPNNQYNRVFATTRQPGSSFKPVLYMAALQQNGMTPLTRFKSEPTTFTYDDGRLTYQPHNYNDKYINDFIDMRQAIASSDNIYAVNTIMQVGADNVIAMARKLGIDSTMKPVPSLALGTFPVSPFEMASAFGTFANSGVRVKPIAVLRIEDREGDVLYEAKHESEQVVDAAHAYVITSLMESVFDTGGTGHRVSATINRPVAGKTGTTSSDAWLVGYTPELATAVWVGYDKGRQLTTTEAHRAAPIFASFTEGALATVPPKIFPMPEGVVSAYIDPKSGKLAGAGCEDGKRLETFIAGTQPLETCDGSAQNATKAGDGTGDRQEQQRKSWWNDLKRWWTN